MEKIVYKNISELSEFDDQTGVISGYANVYNIKDFQGDISVFGSFTKTVNERKNKIKIFKNHSPQLVGIPIELDITDTYGLGLKAKMLLNTDIGRDAYNEVKFLYENGFETGMSIGGNIVKRNPKNKSEVLEYRLNEISVLTTNDPANELSIVSLVKSINEMEEETINSFWNVVEKAYNVKFSDNILKSLESFLLLKNEAVNENNGTSNEKPADVLLSIYELYR
jgi:HK97 family phage prohead protease